MYGMKILLCGKTMLEKYIDVLNYCNVEYDTLFNMKDFEEYDRLLLPGGIDGCPHFYG